MDKKKREFSKNLLVQESALIWVLTLSTLSLAYLCIKEQFMGPLPWLATMVSCAWAAYGVSQVYYYKKSLAENTTGGIKYQSVISEIEKVASQYQDAGALNFDDTPTMNSVVNDPYVYEENPDEYQI